MSEKRKESTKLWRKENYERHLQNLRNWSKTEKGKASRKRRAQTYRKKHYDRIVAGRKVRYAVRIGKLIRPTICPQCFSKDREVQAHHEDYTKPFEIIWLCKSCHLDLHGQLLRNKK